ncbi:hypothetical protein BDY19DRAFT_996598 [Irpex rosettiformis]|uniref:Uncharacterized protein n=1 Tax=Irpex rosettiformis TaxID=378272 RepID=A0ACB8TUI6_9APHY|nr:hypothetical protein BDY19DRAFT_996598 [Irpex rosettiformis]
MHFFAALTVVLPAIISVIASPTLQERDRVLTSIVAPADATVIQPGQPFSFQYSLNNWCEAGYTPISLYLTQDPPTLSDVDGSGKLDQSIFHFGDFLYNNFGLPQMSPFPPPSTFTMPTLDASLLGTTIYFAAVQTELQCPPDGHTEHGIDSNSIQYGSL